MMTPDQLAAILADDGSAPRLLRHATIPGTYTTGQPTLTFDGESTPTTKTWPRLASYTPAANDRVAVLMTGASGIILGKIV